MKSVIKKVLALLLLSGTAFAASGETEIRVNYHPGEIRYIHKNKTVKCSQNKRGSVVLGCARDKKKVSMRVDCANRLLLVDVFSTDREIEIHSDLKKDSCEYREVLDHELTHMDLHAEALDGILNQGMNNIVDAFNSKLGCKAATESARRAFNQFVQKYQAEDRRINQEFDRNDEDSVLQNCKTPPKVRIFYKPAEVTYVSVNRPVCSHEKIQCTQRNGARNCSDINLLSCTDMPVSFKAEIKTYLGRVDISILAPVIKTKISSRYPTNTCEYDVLKNFELAWVDAMEDVLYDFTDTVKPAIESVYNEALESEYSGKELTNAVQKVLQQHIQQVGKEISRVEALFKPLSEEELNGKCGK